MQNGEKLCLLNEIKSAVKESIDMDKPLSDDEIEGLITEAVFRKSKDKYIALGEKRDVLATVFNSIRRFDILQPIMEDKAVNEIMVNGADNVFVERFGKVSKLDVAFEDRQKLEDVIQSIVSRVNRVVNESSPIVDARMPDGSRVNVVLPPVALNGPILTIRKFPERPLTIEDLIKKGTLTSEAAEVLQYMVEAKYNIFICGGTSSGKTTFLNALSNFIPKEERIVTIEDSAELQITDIENIVRLETRNSNTEGKGEITIRDLIRTSLRMRPERIIVGEVRGPEALDMLQAMNTGHDGSLSTGHANSTKDMLSRLETMVLCGALLPLDAIRQQISSAIDIIIHLAKLRDRTRRVTEITEVVETRNGLIELNPIYLFSEEGELEDKSIIGSLKRTDNRLVNTYKLKMAGFNIQI